MQLRRVAALSFDHRVNPASLSWLAAAALLSGSALVLAPGSAAAAVPTGCTQSGPIVTCIYGFTGATETFTPPHGVFTATVTLTGASGGQGADFPGGGPGGVGGTSPGNPRSTATLW